MANKIMEGGPEEAEASGAEQSEVERAKAELARVMSKDIASHMNTAEAEQIGKYIGRILADRVAQASQTGSEDDKVVLLEGAQATMPKINVSFGDRGLVRFIGEPKKLPFDSGAASKVLEEYTRAQLLARAAEIDYKGRAMKIENRSDSHNAPHLKEWAALYGGELRGLATPNDSKAQVKMEVNIPDNFQKQDSLSEMAFEIDEELFADTMMMFAVREGAHRGQAADSWTKAWQQMPGKGYDQYGTDFLLSEEGLPYRPEHKKKDIALIKERLKLFGAEEVESFKEVKTKKRAAERRTKELEGEKEVLAKGKREAEEKKAAAEDKLAQGKVFDQMRQEAAVEQEKQLKAAEQEVARLQGLLAQIKQIADGKNSFGARAQALKEIAGLAGSVPPEGDKGG